MADGDRMLTFGNATIRVPQEQTCTAIFQRLVAKDERNPAQTRRMCWQDIGKYGRLRAPGEFKGTYHEQNELLPP